MLMTIGRQSAFVAILAFLGTLAACDQPGTTITPTETETSPPPAPPPPPPPPLIPETDPIKATAKRIADLTAIKAALEVYYTANGKYPAAYDGLKSVIDRGVAWIPDLTPQYMSSLPRDPALSDSADGPQYLYVSDTKGYKLIAQSGNAGHCAPDVEQNGLKIDPARVNKDGCWAFGFWTDSFAKF